MDLHVIFTLQRDIGALQEGQRAISAALERLRTEMHSRADRVEQRLWHMQQPQPMPSTSGGLKYIASVLQQMAALVKVCLPLVFLAAVVALKITHPDLLPLLRQILGEP